MSEHAKNTRFARAIPFCKDSAALNMGLCIEIGFATGHMGLV
ncbi:MAG: hypothetical protein RSC55_01680 [Oscillospiraceae bacterium]